jgi:radical SAM protein with 4Fe4S-binding SPASM domain
MHIATRTTYEKGKDIDYFKDNVMEISDLVTIGRTKLEHIDVEQTKLEKAQKDILANLKNKESMVEKRFLVCPEVFGKLSIDWDGQVTACCNDYNREMIVGDINQNTIEEIFNNIIIKRYRDILRKREFLEIPKCSRCFDLMNIQTE